MATTVVLHDEGARRALESALWFHLHEVVIGETDLWNACYDAYSQFARQPEVSERPEAAETLLDIEGLSSTIDQVRIAVVGKEVEVDIAPAALVSGLTACRELIEEDEQFWGRPAEQREQMLATRDSAVALIANLTPAEAVT